MRFGELGVPMATGPSLDVLTVDEAAALVARVSLAHSAIPMKIRVHDRHHPDDMFDRRGHIVGDIRIDFEVPDRETGTPRRLVFSQPLFLPCPKRGLVDQVRRAVLSVYEHEALEAIIFDGVRVFDPHQPHEYERAGLAPPARPGD